MKHKLIFVLAILAIPERVLAMKTIKLEGHEISALEKFFKKYTLPDKYAKVVESHKDAIKQELDDNNTIKTGGNFKSRYIDFAWLPEFFFNDMGPEGLINSKRAEKVINNNNLTNFRVAESYVYIIYENPIFFTKKVELSKRNFGDSDGKLTLEETQQLVTFAEQTGLQCWSFGPINSYVKAQSGIIIPDNDNKLVLFDIRDDSCVCSNYNDKDIPEDSPVRFVASLYFIQRIMDADSVKWFQGYYDIIKETWFLTKKKTNRTDVIIHNAKLDDPDFNLENIKQYLTNVENSKKTQLPLDCLEIEQNYETVDLLDSLKIDQLGKDENFLQKLEKEQTAKVRNKLRTQFKKLSEEIRKKIPIMQNDAHCYKNYGIMRENVIGGYSKKIPSDYDIFQKKLLKDHRLIK